MSAADVDELVERCRGLACTGATWSAHPTLAAAVGRWSSGAWMAVAPHDGRLLVMSGCVGHVTRFNQPTLFDDFEQLARLMDQAVAGVQQRLGWGFA
jgi:hypothetical protein